MAASTSVRGAACAAAFNGVGLALVIPAVQAVAADAVPPSTRGAAFGAVGLAAGLGGMAAAFGATAAARASVHGIEGWRVAFGAVAGVSAAVAAAVALFAVDPRAAAVGGVVVAAPVAVAAPVDGDGDGDGDPLLAATAAKAATTHSPTPWRHRAAAAIAAAASDAREVLSIPTFRVVVVQGVVGSMPWTALLFATLYLQLLGVPDVAAGALTALFTGACAVGGLLGGALGDAAARAAPHAGRVAVAQASVAAGIPLTFALLKGLPTSPACAASPASPACVTAHAALLVVTGALISWCGANNSAVFADVVPSRLRGTIYAFDRSFEGAVAATATPLVGIIAERVFGFTGSLADAPTGAGGEGGNAARARALASALLLCCTVPWAACFLAYFWLYRIYPRDARRAWPHSASFPDLAAVGEGSVDGSSDRGGGGGRGRGRGRGLGSFELQPRRSGRC